MRASSSCGSGTADWRRGPWGCLDSGLAEGAVGLPGGTAGCAQTEILNLEQSSQPYCVIIPPKHSRALLQARRRRMGGLT